MLFIGRTMNKETQLGRKEKGREKIGQSTVLRILLVESRGRHRIDPLEMCAAGAGVNFSPHRPCACFHFQSLQKKKGEVLLRQGCVRIQMLWVRPGFRASPLLKAGVTVQYS